MQGTPPDSQRRSLTLGNQVFENERIETSNAGSGQLLFVDQTSLTVAPDSDIVLDSYVYDPATSEGEMALSLTRGTLRFIGGRVSKNRDAQVRTPSATIGIRGGMVLIQVDADGKTRVTLVAGEYVVIEGATGGKVTLSRPNAMAEVSGSGEASFVGIASSADLTPIFKSLEGAGTGGAGPATVSNAAPSTEQVAIVNSGQKGGSQQAPVSTSGEQPSQEQQNDQDTPVLTRPQEAQPPLAFAPPPPEPVNLPSAGSLFTGSLTLDVQGFPISANIAFDPVTDFSSGSIIVNSASGTNIRIEIPTESVDLFDSTDIAFNPTVATSLLTPANEEAGYWELFTTDLSPDPAALPPGSIGQLNGTDITSAFGYADTTEDAQFHIGSITAGVPGSEVSETVNFLFGDGTPGGGAAHLLDDGSFGAQANTVDVYESDQINFGPTEAFDTLTGEAPEILIVGNAGESRTDGTARWLSGNVSFSPSGFGSITVFEDTVDVDQQGPILSTTAETVTQLAGFDGASSTLITISEARGTVLDSEGNSLWGRNGEYLVLGPVNTESGGQTFVEGSLTHVPTAGALREEPVLDRVPNPVLRRYQRAPGRADIVENPTPLLNDNGTAPFEDVMQAHFGGFARCTTGVCGSNFADGDPTGHYDIQGTGRIEFEDPNAGGESNRLSIAEWQYRPFSSGIDPGGFEIEFGNPPGSEIVEGTYLDDRTFGISETDTGYALRQVEGPDITPARSSFVLGSAALLGAEGLTFDPSVNLDPEFSRWGFWAGTYEATNGSTGETRLDVVIAQPWVAGPTAPDLLPQTGLAAYDGFAIAQQANNDTGFINMATGTFELVFDFGLGQGEFDLSLPDFGITTTGLPISGAASGSDAGLFSGLASSGLFSVSGQFTGTPSSPDGGVIGSFDHIAGSSELHTKGVFAGDKLAVPPIGFLPLLDPAEAVFASVTLSDGSLGDGTGFDSLLGATWTYDRALFVDRGSVIVQTDFGRELALEIPQSPFDTTLTNDGDPFTSGFDLIEGTTGTWFNALDDFESADGTVESVVAGGFSDLDPNHQFHFVAVQGIILDPETGTVSDFLPEFAVLGQAAPGQGQMHVLDDGSFDTTANTVEVLELGSLPSQQALSSTLAPFRSAEGNLIIGGAGPLLFNRQDILLIGNAGEARLPETETAAPNGARWLSANVRLSEPFVVPTGNVQFSAGLGVLAGPARQDGQGNIVLSLEGTSLGVEQPAGPLVTPTQIIRRENIGNFATPEGTTTFGSTGQYQVIGSFNQGVDFADGSGGGLQPLDQITSDPGTITFLHDDTAEVVPNNLSAFVTVRDDTASIVIDDPFPLAEPTPGFSANGLEQLTTTGFAVGHFFCSDGNCDNNGTGVYETRSDDLQIDFGNRAGTVGEDFFGIPDSNTVQAEMTLSFPFDDNFAGTTSEDAPFFNFDTITVGSLAQATSDETGAAASDSVFGINISQGDVRFTVTEFSEIEFSEIEFSEIEFSEIEFSEIEFSETGPITETHTEGGNTFLLASSGLAGVPEGFLPEGVDAAPEFMRWGYWAADINVRGDDDGDLRHDTVPVGFWVAGPDQDATNLPFAGTATYSGLVAASLHEIGSGAVAPGIVGHHGGSFAMDYNFGTSSGSFDYSLPSAGIGVTDIPIAGDGTGSVSYQGGIFASTEAGVTASHFVDGRFYGTAANPVAGTGGTIEIFDNTRGLEGQAVFGGDRTSFTPSIPAPES